MRHVNDTVFQKTLALSDFYFGSDDWDYPLGLIQMCATSHTEFPDRTILSLVRCPVPGSPVFEISRTRSHP